MRELFRFRDCFDPILRFGDYLIGLLHFQPDLLFLVITSAGIHWRHDRIKIRKNFLHEKLLRGFSIIQGEEWFILPREFSQIA